MGYPLFGKPFDGGGLARVSRSRNRAELMAAYDDSGEMLMHLQKSVEPFDVFARALTIGPETSDGVSGRTSRCTTAMPSSMGSWLPRPIRKQSPSARL